MDTNKQMKLLNIGSHITRLGTGKKPFTVGDALKLLNNLGVK